MPKNILENLIFWLFKEASLYKKYTFLFLVLLNCLSLLVYIYKNKNKCLTCPLSWIGNEFWDFCWYCLKITSLFDIKKTEQTEFIYLFRIYMWPRFSIDKINGFKKKSSVEKWSHMKELKEGLHSYIEVVLFFILLNGHKFMLVKVVHMYCLSITNLFMQCAVILKILFS